MNRSFHRAAIRRRDEFYTPADIITSEIEAYPEDHWRGAHVICPFDNVYTSAFPRVFMERFSQLGLASLTSISYTRGGRGLYSRIVEVPEGVPFHMVPTWGSNNLTVLEGDGSFLSSEVEHIVSQCAREAPVRVILVSNPPFSLVAGELATRFFDFYDHLGVNFLMLLPLHHLAYAAVFPRIVDGTASVGHLGETRIFFDTPYKEKKAGIGGLRFLTTLPCVPKPLPAYREPPHELQRYSGYPAYHCERLAHLPRSRGETYGVPLTFLDCYSPSLHEILGTSKSLGGKRLFTFMRDGELVEPFTRIIMRYR